ncbi:hypothetical protein V6N13_033699 [Hibiscus sabdariffa]
MWEDRNQHIHESLRPTDAYPYQHARESQWRRVDDPYEEHDSTSISAQLAEVTNLFASLQPPRAAQRVHPMAFLCDCCGEQHSFRNFPYNVEAYGHIEEYNWNQQQNPSWYDQQAQNFFYHNDFVAAGMPCQCCPQQEPSNFMDPELARLNALMRESTVAMNNLLHADMSWQYSPQQELSNSKDDELARLEALVREATHDMNNMLQRSTHWDTEILMQ